MNLEGKLFGMPKKVALLVIGGAILFVVVMLSRRRAPAIGTPVAQEPIFGGGGGGGFAQPVTSGVSSSADEEARRLQLEGFKEQLAHQRAVAGVDLSRRESELGFFQAQLETLRSVLPFQAAAEQARLERAAIEEEKLGVAASKAPVKCPPGMHPANIPGVGFTCRQLGDPDGGRGFQPFRQIGNILGGALRGVEAISPQLAATYVTGALGGYSGSPTLPSVAGHPRRAGEGTWGTPPIAPVGYLEV